MDHKTLMQAVAKRCNCTPDRATRLTAALAEILRESMTARKSVAVPSFGTLTTVKTDERIGMDPETGVTTLYPPAISVDFIPSTNLKHQVHHEK